MGNEPNNQPQEGKKMVKTKEEAAQIKSANGERNWRKWHEMETLHQNLIDQMS